MHHDTQRRRGGPPQRRGINRWGIATLVLLVILLGALYLFLSYRLSDPRKPMNHFNVERSEPFAQVCRRG